MHFIGAESENLVAAVAHFADVVLRYSLPPRNFY